MINSIIYIFNGSMLVKSYLRTFTVKAELEDEEKRLRDIYGSHNIFIYSI